MMDDYFAPDYQENFLKPLVTSWVGKIRRAEESKSRKTWKRLADECMHFYEATASFLWDANSSSKFWEGVTSPTFRVVIAKAFELVAQIGPALFFQAPRRKVTPRKVSAIDPLVFGDVENDPNSQQIYQLYQQEMQQELAVGQARASLLEAWLNYTPTETPGGGLEEHAERAITEALIKGRGVLWPEPYQKPGSARTLTGLFYDSVDNLFIDPDVDKVEDARWIARRRVESFRQVEERFKLPKNSLKDKATLESVWSSSNPSEDQISSRDESSKEMVVYYEIWSKAGCCTDYSNLDERVASHLEEVAGKFVYLAISPSVDYPLNAPTELFRAGAPDDAIRQVLEWPIPYWADSQFPCVMLDFYPCPRSAWPMPPLAPGMGELKFLNVMISHLCNRIWMSSRDFIAVAKSAQKEIESIIREGADLSILPVSDVHKDIKNMVSFLDQPDVNFDVWQIVDRVSDMFDKRTGLTDLVYGMTRTQSRSAEDAATKKMAVSVRPDHMARKVEKWMSRASAMEGFCARWFVSAEDVQPLVGNTAAQIWEWIIDSADVDAVVREMEFEVVAGSGKRRNHEQELANLNQAMQFFMPELSKHADITTDVTALNSMIQRWGDSAQIDLSDIQLGQRMPPPPEGPSPEEIEMQMEQERHQMDMQAKQFDMQVKQAEAEMKLASMQQQSQMKAADTVSKLQASRLQLEQKAHESAVQQKGKATDHLLDMLFSRQTHDQEIDQDQEKHELEMAQLKQRGLVQIQQAKQMAKAKPANSGNGSKSKSNGKT